MNEDDEKEFIMNNQIDVNKLTPREKLSYKVAQEQGKQPRTKKQLLFLKR